MVRQWLISQDGDAAQTAERSPAPHGREARHTRVTDTRHAPRSPQPHAALAAEQRRGSRVSPRAKLEGGNALSESLS